MNNNRFWDNLKVQYMYFILVYYKAESSFLGQTRDLATK